MKSPGKLSTAIDDLLAALGLSNVTLQAKLAAEWPSVVGPLLAGRTAPARLRRGVLTIAAENHSVSQELQFMRPALLESVRALIGKDNVTDVRITVGSVAGGPEAPTSAEAEGARKPSPDARPRAADPDGLDAIPDPETREILRSIARKAACRDQDAPE